LLLLTFALSGSRAHAEIFRFPTANHALLEPGGGEKFFVGTTGKPWNSGAFGCVRTGGWQMHEGLDIKCGQRDKKGEPIDRVMATADGTVVYFNSKPSLSPYGNYLVLRHQVEGLEIYSLYAHLHEVLPTLVIGTVVKAGEPIAVMGRTTNTREGISKERAHVHFELNLLYNERFASWYKTSAPNTRNVHGEWNGFNLAGLDPQEIFLEQARQGAKFSLVNYIRNHAELFRVTVRDTAFPWLKRYPLLIRRNSVAEKEGIAGFEIAFNFNGVPFQLIPRAASEIRGASGKYRLLSVNAEEARKNPCRKLIVRKGSRWELGNAGIHLLDLLTY
jgi:hypothetical protein